MRVLHISSARQYGGSECHIVDLCRGLQARGHEVYAALRPTCEWRDELAFLPEGHIFNVSIRNSFGALSAKKIAAFVRQNDIDIVHAHLPRDYFPGSLACSLAKHARFVLSRHAPQPLKPFNRFALKNLAHAIAVSPEIESSLHAVFPPDKIRSMSAGVDVENISTLDSTALRRDFREFHNIPDEAFVVGTIGQLTEQCGQKEFILAAQLIVKTIPTARFVIAGSDPNVAQGYRNELKRLAGVFGLRDSFLWLDHARDTLSLLAAMDILIANATCGNPERETLEAMALGTPVIITHGTARVEIMDDLRLFVCEAKAVAMAESVHEIFSDIREREQRSAKLRKLAEEKFSIRPVIEQTERLYADLF